MRRGSTAGPTGAAVVAAATLAWSWAWFGLAVASGARWPAPAALVPWALGAMGPAVVAFTLAGRRGEARALLARTLAFSAPGRRWWLVIVVVAVAPSLAARAVLAVVGADVPPLADGAGPLATAVPAVLAFGLAAGLAEEPGWRGTLLPRLTAAGVPVAGLVVGVVWAVWHAPLFAIDGTFQNGLGGADTVWFFLQILPTAVLLAWVTTGTGGIVAAAVALHALANAAGELAGVEGAGRWISLGVLTALAAGAMAAAHRAGPAVPDRPRGAAVTARP